MQLVPIHSPLYATVWLHDAADSYHPVINDDWLSYKNAMCEWEHRTPIDICLEPAPIAPSSRCEYTRLECQPASSAQASVS